MSIFVPLYWNISDLVKIQSYSAVSDYKYVVTLGRLVEDKQQVK